MTAVHWPWSILDIAPTQDRKSIREAYSRLLKALDHEAETEAYMDLRHARDAALSGQFLHAPAVVEDEEDDFGLGSPLPDQGSGPDETQSIADEPEERPVFTVEYSEEDDRRFQRVVDLFLQDEALTSTEAEELERHIDALFADERMADLGHYARVEGWLAQLLADRFPRGADLFPKVAEYFHWAERAHELGIHPAIPWLFNADEGRRVVAEIAMPGHAYHREWTELAHGKPKGPLWTRAVDKQRMANLIATVRRDYPWLEPEHWQPELVARWEKKVDGEGVRGPGPWTWIALAFFALSAVGRFAGTDTSNIDHNPAALSALRATEIDSDIAKFIGDEFPEAAADGRSAETLRGKSPKTYSALQHSADVPESLAEEGKRAMMRDIMEAYYLVVDKLPYDIQVADAGFRVAVTKALKDDPQGCADFIRNPRLYWRQKWNIDAISPEYRYQMFSIVHDHYDDREWASVPKQVDIPGEIVGKLIRRSGVPEERIAAVLRSQDAPDADICRTMGSFYELLTEIPAKEAGKILSATL